MLAAIVVLVNGAFVPAAPPVRRLFGHVMAPLLPVVARLVDTVTLDGNDVILTRGARTCVLRVGSPGFRCDDGSVRTVGVAPFGRDGAVYVPVAAVAAAFGGSATYDARTPTIGIVMPVRWDVATPPPFDPSAPQVVPTRVFTPQPGPPSPRPAVSGPPQPRRTAIPATPSRVPD
jgi:hypothetical protein